MKGIRKVLLLILACICLTLLLTACNTSSDNSEKNCGGIVESYEIKEIYKEIKEGDFLFGIVESGYYQQLTVTFNNTTNAHCYCSEITIYKSDFEQYTASTLNELLSNDDFLSFIQENMRIDSISIEGTTSGARTYFMGIDNLAYLLYYDIYEDYIESPVINKPLEYSGYIKFN